MSEKKVKPAIHNKKRNKIRLHSEGKETLLLCGLVLAIIVYACFFLIDRSIGPSWVYYTIAGISAVIYAILLNFFRCPVRMFQGPTTGSIVAPADGHVVVIEEVDETEYFHDRRLMISIFMSLTNVHANWIPCECKVTMVEHQDGNFH